MADELLRTKAQTSAAKAARRTVLSIRPRFGPHDVSRGRIPDSWLWQRLQLVALLKAVCSDYQMPLRARSTGDPGGPFERAPVHELLSRQWRQSELHGDVLVWARKQDVACCRRLECGSRLEHVHPSFRGREYATRETSLQHREEESRKALQ